MTELTEIQRDATVELLNLAIGRAASALNAMVEEEVSLSIPIVEFITRGKATELLELRVANGVSAIKQEFLGPFPGEVFLIFPEEKSLELARIVIGDEVVLGTMTELEQEALLEVGNIILNACIGTLANQFDEEIKGFLPVFLTGSSREILQSRTRAGEREGLALFLEIDFNIEERDIAGYVVFILDIHSANSFKKLVDIYVSKIPN